MNYYKTEDPHIIDKANRLLYHVLWEPLAIAVTARKDFKTEGCEHIFIASDRVSITGVFVLVMHSDNKVELRHAAVAESYQNRGIGKRLWFEGVKFARAEGASEIFLYARSTTIEYWLKLGLKEDSEWFDHPEFKKHGIRFKKIVCSL